MENLDLAATTSTPEVHFDASTGRLVLRGESYPENSFEFFRPLLAWITAFLAESRLPVRVEVSLTYLNTSSIRSLMDVLDQLEEAHQSGREVTLTWYYDKENDRALDMAGEFREEVTLPFFVVPEE